MLVEAATGWVFGWLGDAGLRLVVGSQDERLLRRSMADAVEAVIERADPDSRDGLRKGLAECFTRLPQVTEGDDLVGGLRAAVVRQVGSLALMQATDGSGRLFFDTVNVEEQWLADELAKAFEVALRRAVAATSTAEYVRSLDSEQMQSSLAEQRDLLVRLLDDRSESSPGPAAVGSQVNIGHVVGPVYIAGDHAPAQDPVADYLARGLSAECDLRFPVEDRFGLHPGRHFVDVLGSWPGEANDVDIVSAVFAELRRGRRGFFALCANYGQGKTFTSWRIALAAAAEPSPVIPFFFPLREFNPASGIDPVTQVAEHTRARVGFDPLAVWRDRPALLILDGLDEMLGFPAIQRESLHRLVWQLSRFERLSLLVSFRPGTFENGCEGFARQFPAFTLARPALWHQDGRQWVQLLERCAADNLSFPGGVDEFRAAVARMPVRDLTTRPLWCRMIIETRDSILQRDVHTEADLYSAYTDWFFTANAPRQRGAQMLGIADKSLVLEMLAAEMARAAPGAGRYTMYHHELLRLVSSTLHVDHDVIAAFLAAELATYTLVVVERTLHGEEQTYSFGHQSFEDYFLAKCLLRLLRVPVEELADEMGRLAVIADKIVARTDVLAFAAGLLRGESTDHRVLRLLRTDLRDAVGDGAEVDRFRQALTLVWLRHCRLVERPYDLSRAQLEGLVIADEDLTNADLSGADVRRTRFVRCVLTGADFRDAEGKHEAHFEDCIDPPS